jgi:hypothetical protein
VDWEHILLGSADSTSVHGANRSCMILNLSCVTETIGFNSNLDARNAWRSVRSSANAKCDRGKNANSTSERELAT